MINYIGRKFGRGTVMAEAETYVNAKGGKQRMGLLQCSCGNQYLASYGDLVTGKTKSCGCFRLERATKHGHCKNKSFSRTYSSWRDMKRRCTNPNHKQFHNYGGRGISVCEHWKQFENFIADMGECPPGLEIDRIDNNGNYEPGNCRWATEAQQQRNRRNNRFLTVFGVTACLKDLAAHFGINRETARARLCKGLAPELAFTQSASGGDEWEDTKRELREAGAST